MAVLNLGGLELNGKCRTTPVSVISPSQGSLFIAPSPTSTKPSFFYFPTSRPFTVQSTTETGFWLLFSYVISAIPLYFPFFVFFSSMAQGAVKILLSSLTVHEHHRDFGNSPFVFVCFFSFCVSGHSEGVIFCTVLSFTVFVRTAGIDKSPFRVSGR